jgi:hypothetical protein
MLITWQMKYIQLWYALMLHFDALRVLPLGQLPMAEHLNWKHVISSSVPQSRTVSWHLIGL